MKKYLLGLFVLLFSITVIVSCTDPIVPDPEPEPTPWDDLNPGNTQWGIVYNYTADWCFYCGDWGVDRLNTCVNKGHVIGMVVKASGDPNYNASLFSSFNNDRAQGSGVPSFWMVDTKSSNASDLDVFLARTPKASVDMKHEYVGDSMIIYSSVKTLTGYEPGEYYLSIVVHEDGLQYPQNGYDDPNYKHKFVSRKAYNDASYGVPVTLTIGTKNNFRHAIYMDPTWVKANCYASVVLYKKEGTTKPLYKFVNGCWSRP
jgi:hypothetical protein